ncbi:MAG TPA: hypothetical protein VNS58_21455 [Puia sp.]|nr:hypothetical protein [Puia sp.]
MRPCRFSINFNGDVNTLFQQALREERKYNAQIIGDANNGFFEVSVLEGNYKGNYSANNNLITIELSSKPIYIPCTMIEALIKKHLPA